MTDTAGDQSEIEGAAVAASSHAEDLFRAASTLLASGLHLHAVLALHRELHRTLGHIDNAGLPGSYSSSVQAEEEHRRLLAEYAQRRAQSKAASRLDLWRRLPAWASWGLVLVVTAGLSIRYAVAVVERVIWQRQYPEGNWTSRYYTSRRFEGSPLLRYDVGVDYDWGMQPPVETMPRDEWSARWDTCVVVTADVALEVRLVADDSSKLILDEVPLIEIKKPGRKDARVLLRSGLRHLRVDFQEGRRKAEVHLRGLNFDGTDSYHFQRPVLDGAEARCEERGAVSALPARSDGASP